MSDPVGPTCLRRFSTSNGCQDHTTSPSATCAVRLRALRPLTRFNSPCDPRTCRRCRVHRIPPRVRDDRASAPLWDGTGSDILLIWGKREAKFFCKGGWTGFSDLPVEAGSKADLKRRRHDIRLSPQHRTSTEAEATYNFVLPKADVWLLVAPVKRRAIVSNLTSVQRRLKLF